MHPTRPRVLPLARLDYGEARERMRGFTGKRTADTPDEIWLVEHPPVFTLGLATRPAHLPGATDIPIVQTERGGQITYHGPGQLLAYTLIDLRRRRLTVHGFVGRIEQAVIDTLASLGLAAMRRERAPGVYLCSPDGLPGAKIASIGIKVSHGCTYHGVALNVAMDLAPFSLIDPCGYPGMPVTDLRSQLGQTAPAMETVAPLFGEKLADLIEGTA